MQVWGGTTVLLTMALMSVSELRLGGYQSWATQLALVILRSS